MTTTLLRAVLGYRIGGRGRGDGAGTGGAGTGGAVTGGAVTGGAGTGGAGTGRRRRRRMMQALAGGFAALSGLMMSATTAFAVTFTGATGLPGPTGAAGDAPGVKAISNLTGWITQYGWAGAPLAISVGGLLMAIEHHQQRTGNAIRAKGYIFAGAAGVIVISLASTATAALKTLAGVSI
ncbi:MAG TPA: hypothetical protein VMD59_11795 [Acidimicrobiales bacterium]|nr:hypothetical protein [Acidimicrobiales bacterium]